MNQIITENKITIYQDILICSESDSTLFQILRQIRNFLHMSKLLQTPLNQQSPSLVVFFLVVV